MRRGSRLTGNSASRKHRATWTLLAPALLVLTAGCAGVNWPWIPDIGTGDVISAALRLLSAFPRNK